MEFVLTFLDLLLVIVTKERVEEDVNSMMNAPYPTSVQPVIERWEGSRGKEERERIKGQGERERGLM